MTAAPKIRAIKQDDLPHLWHMIRELSEFQNMPGEMKCTVQDLRQSLFPTRHEILTGQVVCSAKAYFLERDLIESELSETIHLSTTSDHKPNRLIIGYCLYYFQYSTFLGQNNVHVEDLFIRKPYRAQGYGTLFLHSIIQHAIQYHKAKRVEWEVLNDNLPAIHFYEEKCGAQPKSEWGTYRVSDHFLEKFRKLPLKCEFEE